MLSQVHPEVCPAVRERRPAGHAERPRREEVPGLRGVRGPVEPLRLGTRVPCRSFSPIADAFRLEKASTLDGS